MLILVVVDFLIFHDLFKIGENYTVTEYLTGIVSILIFLIFGKLFLTDRK